MTDDGSLVPWLAASGPLAYTPETPPIGDYYFQYGWVLSGILSDQVNKRRHFYFGAFNKERAGKIFEFWKAARARTTSQVAVLFGKRCGDSITAPMAAYATHLRLTGDVRILIQHGSYQIVDAKYQPLLERAELIIYRGIQQAEAFRFLRFGTRDDNGHAAQTWNAFEAAQYQMMSDSVLSFNTVHDRVKRTETGHIRDGSRHSDEIAHDNGLDLQADTLASALWNATHQSFTLIPWLAENKFGPHYIKCKTPLDNVRITTFFAGEHEVKIIDPDRVDIVDSVGCKVHETDASQYEETSG